MRRKVYRESWALFLECQFRMSISSFLGWVSSFSVMSEMSSLGVFFGRRSSLLFWQRVISCLYENTVFMEYTENIIFPCIFLRKIIFSFSVHRENILFWGKKSHLSWYKEDHIPRRVFWKDHLFRTFKENIIFPCIFWKRSSFIFRLKYKIIFSNNTKKIIFQCDFFGKTILSEHLEKENNAFCTVKVSRNVSSPLLSSSLVNLIFWWRLLIWWKNFSKCVRLRIE